MRHGFCRVNVPFVADINTARIAQSDFLTSEEKGNIMSSSPEIARSC